MRFGQRPRRAAKRRNSQRHILAGNGFRRVVADAAFAAHKQHAYRPTFGDGDRIVPGAARQGQRAP